MADIRNELVVSSVSTFSTRVTVEVLAVPGAQTNLDFGSQSDFDFDLDRVSDAVEDAAPNNGDGSGDGTPDSRQANVASLPNAVTGGYATLVAPEGTQLVDVQAINPNAPDSPVTPPPPGVVLPLGLFQFTVAGVAPGATVEIQLIDHSGQAGGSYYKFGATPGNPTEEWYEFDFDGITGAQRLISPPTRPVFSLTFVNGARGDDDLDVNNTTIVDPGGPAIVAIASLDVAGPNSGVRGQPLSFAFTTDPPGDYTYDVDWDGDGTVDESLAGSETLTAEHIYPAEGNYSLTVTATNSASGASADVAHDVSIDVVAVIDGDLAVGGTTADDHIKFKWHFGDVVVQLNGQRLGPFVLDDDARLIAYGQAGDDHITTSLLLDHDVDFYGGQGEDDLHGGRGNDLLDGGDDHDMLVALLGSNILLGGAGDDLLLGGLGRDLLIGGTDRDHLFGLFGQDILIGGTTLYDDDRQALQAIRAEWAAFDPYEDRVAQLRDETRPYYLKPDETVFEDGAVDFLFGGIGLDWFFLDEEEDLLFGKRRREALN